MSHVLDHCNSLHCAAGLHVAAGHSSINGVGPLFVVAYSP